MRPPTPQSAKGRAWEAFAAFIRHRDPRCITCGGVTTEAGHFIHNSDKKNKQLGGNLLWYSPINVNGQCGGCNRWKSGWGSKYALRLEEKYGKGIVTELYHKYNAPRKYTIEQLLEIEKTYINLLSTLED